MDGTIVDNIVAKAVRVDSFAVGGVAILRHYGPTLNGHGGKAVEFDNIRPGVKMPADVGVCIALSRRVAVDGDICIIIETDYSITSLTPYCRRSCAVAYGNGDIIFSPDSSRANALTKIRVSDNGGRIIHGCGHRADQHRTYKEEQGGNLPGRCNTFLHVTR